MRKIIAKMEMLVVLRAPLVGSLAGSDRLRCARGSRNIPKQILRNRITSFRNKVISSWRNVSNARVETSVRPFLNLNYLKQF